MKIIILFLSFITMIFSSNNAQYEIHWKSNITGFEGKGSPISQADAIAWSNAMNKKYPYINHWIVKV